MKDQVGLFKHLDAPVRFLSFTMGDLFSYLIPLFIGALMDSMLIIPAIGAIVVLILRKIMGKFPRYYAIRFLYWSIPSQYFNRILRVKLPHSNKRLWIK